MPTPRYDGTICLQLVPSCAKRGKPYGVKLKSPVRVKLVQLMLQV